MEDRRERDRRYREKNREAIAERRREYDRRRHAENREAINQRRRESGRDRTQQKRDAARLYRMENHEVIMERRRAIEGDPGYKQRRNAASPPLRARRAHGPTATEVLAAMWEKQEGCCYLCGNPLTRKDAAVDHDHNCCPPAKTCAVCRRGFACRRCNLLIGMVDDDVMLLRRIAGNLGVAIDLYRARVAAQPVQLDLDVAS